MDARKILEALEEEFPGKTILALPEDDPKEIICEVEPSADHPEHSIAIAYIDESVPHRHPVGIETYEVERGTLILTVEGITYTLNEGESREIQPGQLHSARGNATRVKAHSIPGWTFANHVLQSSEE